MHQRKITQREILLPCFDGISKRGFAAIPQIVNLSILPYKQGKRESGK